MIQSVKRPPHELSKDISMKRKEMIELGMNDGLMDERTIKCSQQLDDLLNKYTRET